MCITCGCGGHQHKKEETPEHTHNHSHSAEHRLIELEHDVLYENKLLAERNRGFFLAKNIISFNMVSSPGSGKTTLLERTLIDLKDKLPFAVIEGDQQTSADADRIAKTGTPVKQINTGKGCHLDAHMVMHAAQDLSLEEGSILFIENVGNLVCPAMFDLGETERIVIISTTEGDDKPLKYPDMFHSSSICIINKIDLLPYVNINIQTLKDNLYKVNPHLKIFELSATSGEGMEVWYRFLSNHFETK